MSIAEFLKQDMDGVVDEWVDFARTKVLASQNLSREDLADHARLLLLAIAEDLARWQDARTSIEKSQGNGSGIAPDITRVAWDHAAQRFAQRFSFDDVVAEFRALRASVVRRWTQQLNQVGAGQVDELTRFSEAMDQALSESTSLYSRKVDDSRKLLLGVLGHDLRTPLSVVHMNGNYLLRTNTLDRAQTKAAARILTSAERMATMVKEIPDFMQTAFGVTLPVSRQPADLGEIAEDIVGEVATVHPDSEIQLRCDGILTGRWDAARIGQMLSNLISNAVQHGAASRCRERALRFTSGYPVGRRAEAGKPPLPAP